MQEMLAVSFLFCIFVAPKRKMGYYESKNIKQ